MKKFILVRDMIFKRASDMKETMTTKILFVQLDLLELSNIINV